MGHSILSLELNSEIEERIVMEAHIRRQLDEALTEVMRSEKERGRRGTRERAARSHQGPNHWHVERRSSVLICQPCGERIPAYLRPQYCPNCGAGA